MRTFLLLVVLGATSLAFGQTAREVAPRQSIRYDGLVAPGRHVELRVPIEGLVAEVPVKEGDVVKGGALLLKIDDALQVAATEGARLKAQSDAAVRKAAAAVGLAANTLERVRKSKEAGAAGDWEVQRAETELKQAEAELDASRDGERLAATELQLEEERLRRYRLEAPFDGVVTQVEIERGETATTEEPVLVVVSMDPLEATLFLPVQMHGQLEVGQTYRLSASEPVNAELQGRLTFIDPRIDSASRTIRCLFEIPNPEMELPSGFSVVLASPEPVQAVTEKN